MTTSEEVNKLERLDQLEAKVAEAARIIETLSSRSRTLTENNRRLEAQVGELATRNEELTKEVKTLKTGVSLKFDDKAIIHRIDRMIEKFGELQV